MATNNYSAISSTTTPALAGTYIQEPQWGIDATLSGFIIQSEDYSSERVTDQTQDQKGRVVSELDYDEHMTLTLNMIGSGTAPAVGSCISFKPSNLTGEVDWKVRSSTYNGAFNDKKKYAIELERWTNFPAGHD